MIGFVQNEFDYVYLSITPMEVGFIPPGQEKTTFFRQVVKKWINSLIMAVRDFFTRLNPNMRRSS